MSESSGSIGPNGPGAAVEAGTSRGRVDFLLLMRHMSGAMICVQGKEIGEKLFEYIEETELCDELKITSVDCLYPRFKEDLAAKTAKKLIEVFNSRTPNSLNRSDKDHKIVVSEDLSPYEIDPLNPYSKVANPYFGHQIDRRQSNEQLDDLDELLGTLCKRSRDDANARLVVGHSPQIDWLLHELVKPPWRRRWLWSYQHSFAPGEVICVQLDKPPRETPRGRAIWSLAPTDNDTEALLREKIRGKMESAKLLGGAVGAGIGFVLAGFHDLSFSRSSMLDDLARVKLCMDEKVAAAQKAKDAVEAATAANSIACIPRALDLDRMIPFAFSIALLAIAAGLYWFAYLSYDRLLMPKRFWIASSRRRPAKGWLGLVWPPSESALGDTWRRFNEGSLGVAWRPPSSSALIMHQNMQRIWYGTFIPATGATGIALLFLAYAATIQQFADALRNPSSARYGFMIASLFILVLLALWRYLARPVFGAQD
jgi:hypothetical protein